MTTYGPGDLEGWEFKILRSASRRTLGTPEGLRTVLAEEAEAGWELVEKFDDYRIRLKRRVEDRARDDVVQFDPYRTSVGKTPGGLVVALVAGVVLVLGLVAALALNVA